MSEEEKIEQVIAKYKTFFEDSDADVSKSIKGVWHLFRYDEKNECYECFIRFKTADELERIILSEVANDMNIAMELTAETIAHRFGYSEINDTVMTSNYDENVRNLIFNLSAIEENLHLFEVVSKELKRLKQ